MGQKTGFAKIKERYKKFVKRKEKERKTPEKKIIKSLPHVKEIKKRLNLLKEVNKYDKKILAKKPKKAEFIKTGIPGMDELFEKGVPKGISVLLPGGPGSGKTIFCLQVLYTNALKGEPSLYISFEESEERLIQHMRDFRWDIDKLMEKKLIKIIRVDPFRISRKIEALMTASIGELAIGLDEIGYLLPLEGIKPSIIVFDSLSALGAAFTEGEKGYRVWIEQLFRFLEKMQVTSFLIAETEHVPAAYSHTGVEEFLADGVIVFYNAQKDNVRVRALEILKLRGAKHERKIVPFDITDKGIVVYSDQPVFIGK